MSILRSLPLAAGLFLSACAYSPRVATDFDPAANFASYRTYTMLPVAVPRGMNPLMYRRLEATIDGALQARGFTRAEPGDFAVSFTLGENDRTEIDSYGGYGGYYPGWGGRGWGGWGGGWGGG